MVEGIDGFGWFGLVVYFSVMGFVIKGVHIPIPLFISRPLFRIAITLRLRDPIRKDDDLGREGASQPASLRTGKERSTPSPSPPAATPPAESSKGQSNGNGSTEARPTMRSRTESKIGVEPPAKVEQKNELEQEAGSEPFGEGRTSRIHKGEERWTIPLDLRTAPVTGVILLLITTTIDGSVLRKGIVGEDGVRPYDVLVLFISLAYISTALDSTGGLRALAFFISQKSARTPKMSPTSAEKTASGIRLYTTLYAFWFLSGLIVGNDPIVLSGTAFLGYMTRVTGITAPAAWTFSQFIAANVASAALVSSNPTNVLIAGAFELNFLTGYTKNTILPCVVCAVVAYPILVGAFTFFKPPQREGGHAAQPYIPAQLVPPDVDPRTALLDPNGAVFHTTLMLVTLATLVGTSFVKSVEVWMVTAPAGIVGLLRDLWSERSSKHKGRSEPEAINLDELPHLTTTSTSTRPPRTKYSLPAFFRLFKRQFPTTATTISRLPLSLLPFAGGIFVLARALTSLGWTSIFASWLAKICVNPAAAVFFLGYFIALVLCPLCGTNIGATILLVEILRDANFSQSARVLAEPKILTGAIFSTAIASNLGAFSWTFSSSLAGLLWVTILRQKGIQVTMKEFAGWNCLFLPILSTVASAVVLMQVYYF